MASSQLELPPQSSPPLIGSPLLLTTEWYLLFNGVQRDLTSVNSRIGTIEGLGNAVAYGTHAIRLSIPATSVPDASMFVETDRNGLVYQVQTRAWVYVSGTYQRTQAQLAALAATLTASDNGLLVQVTDYAHLLVWTNPAWGWAPGEPGSGMLVPFAVAPTGSGWHLCDGTAGVAYLKADGSTGTVTLPNTATTAAYLKLGPAYSATITAAVVPTVGANNTSTTNVAVTGATTVAANGHIHTVALPGDPIPNFPAPLYFRQ